MTKEEFYNAWLETFAATISENDLDKYVRSFGDYIWHIFSWELIGSDRYLVGNAARDAYDSAGKDDACYIEWFEDDITKPISSELDTASALDNLVEVYVVGNDFEWTYIKTHENMCGPYFLRLKR